MDRSVAEYLDAAGVAPICIIEFSTGCFLYSVLRSRINAAISVHWVDRQFAIKIARLARRNGAHNDKMSAERELHRAASHYRVHLTPHLIAVSRAQIAAKKLLAYLNVLNQTGDLAAFNKEYKRRRMAATANGHSFMTYKTAMMRFRRAIITMLIEKRAIELPLFDEVFGETKCLAPT
jgi:hypothetical protein